ncbi:transcription factor PIF3-like [Olea europaea var. sylvestris]|uniref:transcription factor PIF3-like n=1 Tax=Olea europaea var. sylvestris TaxID=158386 RepID=UPI000C1D5E97|nr:transcription factor PIF3-like [Olea europaea var. sylvestris]
MTGHEFMELVWENGEVLIRCPSSSTRDAQLSPSSAKCSSLTKMKRKDGEGNTTDNSKNSNSNSKTLYSTSSLNECFESYETNQSNPPSVHRSCFSIKKNGENIMESRLIFSKLDNAIGSTSKFAKGESQPLTECGCVNSLLRDPGKGTRTLKNCLNSLEVMTDGSPITNTRELKGSENNKKMDVTSFSRFLRPEVNHSGSGLSAPVSPASRGDLLCAEKSINEEFKVSTSHGSCLLVESTMINCTRGQSALLVAPIDSKPFDSKSNSHPDQQSIVVGCLEESLKFSQGSNNPYTAARRNYQQTRDQSEYLSDGDNQSENVNKSAPARGKTAVKRKRIAEVHRLSEKKRRNEINKRLRTLQELIPNCRKVDKSSVLEEAIEYLKTLQLQLLMMSVSAGPYMPHPMMLPAGLMQQLHTPSLENCPTIDAARASRMGMGAGCSSALQFPTSPISGAVAMNFRETINHQMLGVPSSVSPVPMTILPPLVHSLKRFSARSMANTTENMKNPVDMGFNVPQNVNN